MNKRLGIAVALLMLAPAVLAVLPGVGAASVERTWTQTSQIDFLQGSGNGSDVYSAPGSVTLGGGVSTSKSSWQSDFGSDFWSQQSAPYVSSGDGSLYGGRSIGCCSYQSYRDSISTSAKGQDSVTVYVFPSSLYHQGWYDAHMRLYLRFTDGSYSQDNLLRSVEESSWSGYYERWGAYSAVENINGWNWYRFDFQVPSHMNKDNLRVALYTDTYAGALWSCGCSMYMYNFIAFDKPTSGEFVSNVHDAGDLVKFGSISYSGAAPEGTSLTLQARTSGDGVSFSPWATALSGEPLPSPSGRFVQYRALMERASTATGLPRLDDVSIRYSVTVDTTPPRTFGSVAGADGCAGWLTSTPVVTLAAQDDISGVAQTRYSVNGGLFLTYAGPFTVGDGVHEVEYYSVDNAGNTEAVKSLSFKADTLAPTTALEVDGPMHVAARTFVSGATSFSLAPHDATSGVASTVLDTGDGAAAYAGAFSFSGDGARAFSFSSEDRACLVESTTATDVFVDATAPEVSLVAPAPASASVAGHSTSDAEAVGILQAGAAELGIYGSDADVLMGIVVAGAAETCGPALADECARLALAALAPSPTGATVIGHLTVEADARDVAAGGDASGLAYVAFYLDGKLQAVATEAPFTWEWDATNESLGTHDVAALAVDNVGNQAVTSTTVNVVPTGVDGFIDSGAFALSRVGAPEFAQALYAFVENKVRNVSPPTPPTPPPPPEDLPLPDELPLPDGVPPPPEDLPLPDELPTPPEGLPTPPEDLPLPPLPGVCLEDVCVG